MPYDTAVPVLVDGLRVRAVFYGADVPKIERETIGGNVEQWARETIAELNTPRAKTTVTIGQPIDLTAPTPASPTPQQTYDTDRSAVLRNAADIAAGIYDAADPTSAANLAKARASYAALTKG